jgi:hypothetical protein
MTFLINPAIRPFRRDPQIEALDVWRAAERLVAACWDQYTTAQRSQAPAAYSAYLAALDAEEAAAGELQQLSLRKAA